MDICPLVSCAHSFVRSLAANIELVERRRRRRRRKTTETNKKNVQRRSLKFAFAAIKCRPWPQKILCLAPYLFDRFPYD